MMRGASGEECGNLLEGKNIIGQTAAVLKNPHKATFNLFFKGGHRTWNSLYLFGCTTFNSHNQVFNSINWSTVNLAMLFTNSMEQDLNWKAYTSDLDKK